METTDSLSTAIKADYLFPYHGTSIKCPSFDLETLKVRGNIETENLQSGSIVGRTGSFGSVTVGSGGITFNTSSLSIATLTATTANIGTANIEMLNLGGSAQYGPANRWRSLLIGDPTIYQFVDVMYGGGVYVFMTTNGVNMQYSSDLITFNIVQLPQIDTRKCITYGNGIFVVVGMNYSCVSSDGSTWTSSACVSGNWAAVTYGASGFVAVSPTGNTMISANGLQWTQHNTGINMGWTSVCYGGGKYVAVASSAVGAGNQVMYSGNGAAWTQGVSDNGEDWTSVTYHTSLNMYVAVGKTVMVSKDGINWLTKVKNTSDNNWAAVTYAEGVLVAVATSGDGNCVMTSTDAYNWTIGTTPTPNQAWSALCYNGALGVNHGFLALGRNTTTIMLTTTYSMTNTINGGCTTDVTLATTVRAGELIVDGTGQRNSKNSVRRYALNKWYLTTHSMANTTGVNIVFDGTKIWIVGLDAVGVPAITSIKISSMTPTVGAVLDILDGGMCYDGRNLWVASAPNSPRSTSLVKVSVEDGSIVIRNDALHTVDLTDVMDGFYTMCFDGTRLWLSKQDWFYVVDPLTLDLIMAIKVMKPSITMEYHIRNLCFDGTYIWGTCTLGMFLIPKTTAYTTIDPMDGCPTDATAMTFDGKYIWALNPTNNTVYKFISGLDSGGGAIVIKLAEYDMGISPRALCCDGTYLWVSNGGSLADPATGTVTIMDLKTNVKEELGVAIPDPRYICFDGLCVWVLDITNNKLYKI